MAKDDWASVDENGKPIEAGAFRRASAGHTRRRPTGTDEVRRAELVAADRERRRLADLETTRKADEWIDGLLAADDEKEAREQKGRAALDAAHFRYNPAAVADSLEIGRETTVMVGEESATYGAGSPWSYFQDLAAVRLAASRVSLPSRDPNLSLEARLRRLRRNDEEWANEARHGGDTNRRLIRQYYSERHRKNFGTPADQSARDYREIVFNFEKRDVSTLTGSMGDFSPPVYFLRAWQLYRAPAASFCALAGHAPLPQTGMSVPVPQLTAPVSIEAQGAENETVTASNPTVTLASVPVITLPARVQASQQLMDRFGPGVSLDQVILTEAMNQAASYLDEQITASVISGLSVTITNSNSPSIGALWADVTKASASLVTTAGTRLPATAVFAPSANVEWWMSQLDLSDRPVFLPQALGDGALAGQADTDVQGQSGFAILGRRFVANDTLPTQDSGAQASVLVGNPERGVLVMTSLPVVNVYPETEAAQLTVNFVFSQYAAYAILYPDAFALLTGSAYPSSPSWSGA